MYTPKHFAMDPDAVRGLLGSAETAQLVTAHAAGPQATLLPVLWRSGGDGGWGSLVFHVTRVNPVWKDPGLGQALAILSGPDAYIDPTWYASHADAPGVPTWNYVTVHARGTLVVRDDPVWVREAAFELSERFGYDAGQMDSEATERMLRAIVGLELPVTEVEAKAKLSQNRSPEDIGGVIAGLHRAGDHDIAAAMEQVSLPHAQERYTLLTQVRGRHLGNLRPG
ncbi:MAG: FMN-binding negative transcriptional regulator [Propioniciclava sp.]